MMDASPRRIVIFTHDTYGLGHVRRSLHFMRSLAAGDPEAAILLVTGSPAVRILNDLPPNVDYVKIPTVVKTGAKKHRPSHLPLPLAETLELRAGIIRETVLSFDPDAFLVDNFPLGSGSELLPTLKALRETRCSCILGLRDILDRPEVVRADWNRQGMTTVLDRYYDRILVYGMKEVLDAAEAYALPPRIEAKIRYCGYVTSEDPPPLSPRQIHQELGIEEPFLLASSGGGGDGYPLLEAFIAALPRLPDLPAVVVLGPLMSGKQRGKLREQAFRRRPGAVVLDSVPDLRSYLAAARLSVSMCGYNTAAEIVALGTRAIVVPRTWRYGENLKRNAAGTEGEQLLRAESLARLGLVDFLPPEEFSPESLARLIIRGLEGNGKSSGGTVPLTGLQAVTDEILELVDGGKELRHAA